MLRIIWLLIFIFPNAKQLSGQKSFNIQFENRTITINAVSEMSEEDQQWEFIKTLLNTTDVDYYCRFYPAGDCPITKDLLDKFADHYLGYEMKPINKVHFTLGSKNIVLLVYHMINTETKAIRVANYMMSQEGEVLKFIDTETEMSLFSLKAMLALIKPEAYNDMLYERENLETNRLFTPKGNEPFRFDDLYTSYIDIVRRNEYSKTESAVRVPYDGPSKNEIDTGKLVSFGMDSIKAQELKNLYDRGLYHYARNEILSTLNEEQLIQLDNHDVKN